MTFAVSKINEKQLRIMKEKSNLYVFIIIKDKNDNIITTRCVLSWAVIAFIMDNICYGYDYFTHQEMQEMKYLKHYAVVDNGNIEIGELQREIDIKPYIKDIPERIKRRKQSPACSLQLLGN